MARRNRPRVILNCIADRCAIPGERIVEFSSENGGGLISFFLRDDGTLSIDVYRTDPTVKVTHSGAKYTQVTHYPERPR